MILGPIIQIIIGLLIWKIVPEWIEYGDKKVREFIKLCCNIVGIIVVLFGAISLIRQLVGLLPF